MTPHRWQQVKTVLNEVLEQPLDQQLVYLERVCGDDLELRREVESLLECSEDIEPEFLAPISSSSESGLTCPEERCLTSPFLESGTVIDGRYEIERELGRGGFSVVYLARERLYQAAGGPPILRPVVIKCLLSEHVRSEWLHRKFQHEIEALSQIDHPHVVGLLKAGELPDGQPYLVMPYIKGETLRSVIASPGMPVSSALGIFQQLCEALTAVHTHGIIHRDLKPENIMLQPQANDEFQVKLIDFGIARLSVSQVGDTTHRSTAVGTLRYMSPEQLLEGKTSVQSDIYSLGIILVELLTGRRPFDSKAPTPYSVVMELIAQQRNGMPALDVDLPDAVRRVLARALAFEPEQRWRSVAEFQSRLLESFDQPSVKSPVTLKPSSRPFRWSRAILATMVCGGLGAGVWWYETADSKSPASIKSVPPVVSGEVQLGWSLTVQKLKNGQPDGPAFELLKEAVFDHATAYRVRINLTPTQTGHVYVINEGPGKVASVEYVKVFPTPTANENQSAVTAHRTVHIPERDWLEFTGGAGTETFWLIWSAKPQPTLETLPVGRLASPELADSVRMFLGKTTGTRSEVVSSTLDRTLIRSTRDLVVYPLRFERR
ncbi:MAG: protein kinase [Acidobacteria bacterium]|nr:protein kinase [Acidobacteriota bacterium]